MKIAVLVALKIMPLLMFHRLEAGNLVVLENECFFFSVYYLFNEQYSNLAFV